MTPLGLLRWQWEAYSPAHGNPVNLWLHILSAPIFWAGTVLVVVGLLELSWIRLLIGFGCIFVTLIVQGRGHKLEKNPPAPFTSPWNFIARLFLEQWITFPRFVLSGGWYKNMTHGSKT